jgi:hypothetical protein
MGVGQTGDSSRSAQRLRMDQNDRKPEVPGHFR